MIDKMSKSSILLRLTLLAFVTILAVKAQTDHDAHITHSFDYTEKVDANSESDASGLQTESDQDLSEQLHQHFMAAFDKVRVMRLIFIIFGSLVTPCGIVLNMTCVVIFAKSKLFRNSSFPYYVYVMSTVDTLNILMRFAIPQSIESSLRYTLVNKYNVSADDVFGEFERQTLLITDRLYCSVFIYVLNSLTLLSVWLMAAVSFERWLVIKFALQTKRMLRIRAACLISFLFAAVLGLNVFDLADGFYIGPNWYANLTIICERDDMFYTHSNATSVYQHLGPIEFNTDVFVLVRTLLQSVVPFLVVLVFNSLIIYNFKKIKSAAMSGNLSVNGASRSKAQSMASVTSGNSLANMSYHNAANIRLSTSVKTRRVSRNQQRTRRSNTQVRKITR
jgi:hypothetical protein